MVQSNYAKRKRRATWLAFGAAIPVGAVVGGVTHVVEPGEHFWMVFLALLLITGLGLLASLPWWRRMDDLQREGQMVSWYWGGTIGAVAVLMALIAGAGMQSAVTKGGLLVFMGQGLAFFAAYAIWWWRDRGEAA